MAWRRKVMWSEGMFLQPQHFQQQARYTDRLVDARTRSMSPHLWGFEELVLDASLLANGRIGIERASGVLPDGTPFSIPDADDAPPALELPADLGNEIVYLALPLSREGRREFEHGNGGEAAWSRFTALTVEARDEVEPSNEPAPIQIGQLNARLVRQRDLAEGTAAIGIAQVIERRADRQVVLDPTYIPPQTRIAATRHLSQDAALLNGLASQMTEALSKRMGQLSHGVSEVADFLALAALNRWEPLLREFSRSPSVHPREFHRDCLQLCGELSTFFADPRRCPELPLYRHDDLRGSFRPVMDHLRRYLSSVIMPNYVELELVDRTHGVRTASLPELELARTAKFVLAVKASMPNEQLIPMIKGQSKIGPAEMLKELVNRALPGISLAHEGRAPRELPFYAGYQYFELDRGSMPELWKSFAQTGNLGLHIGGDFPDLELALWAIRR